MANPGDLQLGDTVVLKRIPASVLRIVPALRDGSDGVLRVYQRACDKASRLRIHLIDELGRPWAEYAFRNKQGGYEFHSLLIDDDSYDLVDRRDA
jgi:hypothetical protein